MWTRCPVTPACFTRGEVARPGARAFSTRLATKSAILGTVAIRIPGGFILVGGHYQTRIKPPGILIATVPNRLYLERWQSEYLGVLFWFGSARQPVVVCGRRH